MRTVVIVGSGASGVHFAQTLLGKGYRVLMVDVGHRRPPAVNPGDDLNGLKRGLKDPAAYFLGDDYSSLILPGSGAEYYGFPPHKKYVFAPPAGFRYRASGFAPLFSFAQGGLAEAWTGGCYPFSEAEMRAFPFPHRELRYYYGKIAERIGISGAVDCLARFFPVHEGLMAPLELDEHSRQLLVSYAAHRSELNGKNCFAGRSRIAALSRDVGNRKRCSYSGRCLWGCASGALYTPSATLAECRAHPEFRYWPEGEASHFRFDSAGKVTKLVVRRLEAGTYEEVEVERLVLAAGTLSTARIFLESIWRDSGETAPLAGLMDNRQVLMPFVNLKMIGRRYEPRNYQYHQVALGVAPSSGDPLGYVHGLVTTLKTALIHPIVQNLPLDLGGGVALFRDLHAALGLVNINFSDHRRVENTVALEPEGPGKTARLSICYTPPKGEENKIRDTCRTFRSLLWKLGCFAPPWMTHVRPMGASVHYSGLIPMSAERRPRTCSPLGQSHDFSNLYFADGISFPELPSKNLTFTLMANAMRIADVAF